MMRQAQQKIIVADHRKIGTVGRSLIWPTADIDKLVVDKNEQGRSHRAIHRKRYRCLKRLNQLPIADCQLPNGPLRVLSHFVI